MGDTLLANVGKVETVLEETEKGLGAKSLKGSAHIDARTHAGTHPCGQPKASLTHDQRGGCVPWGGGGSADF